MHGGTLLSALFPRAMIDLNRARNDIDPELYEGEWPYDAECPANPSNRSLAGIGLIRRLLRPDLPIRQILYSVIVMEPRVTLTLRTT